MTYFIADLHLGHRSIIKYDNRPFQSVEEMDATIIRRWNDRINNHDLVYILGDFAKGSQEELLSYLNRLKGRKVLIHGNHDPYQFEPKVESKFEEITNLKEISIDGNRVVLCHYPIFFHRGDYKENVWMLFGHIHNGRENDLANQIREQLITSYKEVPDPRGQFINVGCMMPYIDYTPRTLDELIAFWKHL